MGAIPARVAGVPQISWQPRRRRMAASTRICSLRPERRGFPRSTRWAAPGPSVPWLSGRRPSRRWMSSWDRATSTSPWPRKSWRARWASTSSPGRARSWWWRTTRPTREFIAADLLAQAEHDPMASAVLVTPSPALAAGVRAEVLRQLPKLGRAAIARTSIERFGAVFLVTGVAKALDLSNRMAPEHLELHLRDPFSHLGKIRNAGAVFVGEHTPEPVGDYVAAPTTCCRRPARPASRRPSPSIISSNAPARSIIRRRRSAARPRTSCAWPKSKA